MTSNISQKWDTTSNDWMNSSQYFYTYDSYKNKTSEIYQVGDGSSWGNAQKIEYYYTLIR